MTVLYSYSKTVLSAWSLLLFFIAACAGCWLYYIWNAPKFRKKTRMIVTGICAAFMVVILFGAIKVRNTTDYIECMISEDYSATKLYDNYNVISKRGEIWVLSFKHPGEVKESKENDI